MSAHGPSKDRDTPLSRSAYAEAEVKWPANLMLATTAIELGCSFQSVALIPLYYGFSNPIEVLLSVLVCLCFAGFNLIVLKGALRFRKFRSYRFVVASVVLFAFPIPCPFCGVLTLPITIWSLVVLRDKYVRERFEAVARGTKSVA